MRKIVAGLFIALDGVYEAPDQWHFPYFNDEMGAAVDEQMKASDTMLLGRKTYEEFAGFWPTEEAKEIDIAPFMNDTPKLVVSNSLKTPLTWQNSTLISGNVNEQLAAAKQQPGKNIGITGSGSASSARPSGRRPRSSRRASSQRSGCSRSGARSVSTTSQHPRTRASASM